MHVPFRQNAKLIRSVVSATFLVSLAACGSGSSSGSSSSTSSGSGAPATNVSVAMTSALNAFVTDGTTISNMTIAGTYGSASATGTASYTLLPAASTTFAGNSTDSAQAATLVTSSLNVSGTGAVSVPTTYSTFVWDVSTNLVGMTLNDSSSNVLEYDVATSVVAFPSTITIGGSGSLATFNRYTDSTMSTSLGTIDTAYSVVANGSSTTSVVFELTEQIYDTGSSNPNSVTYDFVVNAGGTMSLKSIEINDLGTFDLTYTNPD